MNKNKNYRAFGDDEMVDQVFFAPWSRFELNNRELAERIVIKIYGNTANSLKSKIT